MKILLNVRVDPELRERLQAIAKEQNRTLSNLVETELKRVAEATTGAGAEARTEPKKQRR